MTDYFKKIVTAQFEAALCMFNDCIKKCPEEHWDGVIGKESFGKVAYHVLFFVELYLSPNEAAFTLRELHRRGGDELSSTAFSNGLSKTETLAYAAFCRQKALEVFAAETAESWQRESGFSWLPLSRGELHLYNIRHVQHHTGQLSAFLRGIVKDGQPWWVKTGWR